MRSCDTPIIRTVVTMVCLNEYDSTPTKSQKRSKKPTIMQWEINRRCTSKKPTQCSNGQTHFKDLVRSIDQIPPIPTHKTTDCFGRHQIQHELSALSGDLCDGELHRFYHPTVVTLVSLNDYVHPTHTDKFIGTR